LMLNGHLDPSLTYDGVHLNEKGYERIVPLLRPFVNG
jgi:lysophospholipase L1-like esterase